MIGKQITGAIDDAESKVEDEQEDKIEGDGYSRRDDWAESGVQPSTGQHQTLDATICVVKVRDETVAPQPEPNEEFHK